MPTHVIAGRACCPTSSTFGGTPLPKRTNVEIAKRQFNRARGLISRIEFEWKDCIIVVVWTACKTYGSTRRRDNNDTIASAEYSHYRTAIGRYTTPTHDAKYSHARTRTLDYGVFSFLNKTNALFLFSVSKITNYNNLMWRWKLFNNNIIVYVRTYVRYIYIYIYLSNGLSRRRIVRNCLRGNEKVK